MTSLLFVCLGNICRSPLAEAIAKAKASQRALPLLIDSAGTSAHHVGEPPCEYSIRIAQVHGIDIRTYRARQISDQDRGFDRIFALDSRNLKHLTSHGYENVHLLGEFGGYEGADVPDPYYFPSFDHGIAEVYAMIERCIEDIIERIADGTL